MPEGPAAPLALPTITTERLTLRRLVPDDAAALFAIFGDPAVTRYWSHTAWTDLAAAEQRVTDSARGLADGTSLTWGIARRDDDGVIGTCTLWAISHEHRRAEVGYALARAHWGRGYAAEALPPMFDHAFGALALHRLEADVDPRNAASLRALERLGFVREGLLRECYHVAGEVQDAVILGLLARDWREMRGQDVDADSADATDLADRSLGLALRSDPSDLSAGSATSGRSASDVVAESERLVVRRLTLDDAPFVLALLNEPSFLRYIGDRGVRTLDDARAYLEAGPLAGYARHGHGLYLVTERDGGAAVGMCGLLRRDTLPDPDIGFAYLPAYWSRGYAQEAARAVLAHARRDLGLTRVGAIVQPDNAPSIRLLERLGMTFERTVRLADDADELAYYAVALG